MLDIYMFYLEKISNNSREPLMTLSSVNIPALMVA